jgi:hypothetical protein
MQNYKTIGYLIFHTHANSFHEKVWLYEDEAKAKQ